MVDARDAAPGVYSALYIDAPGRPASDQRNLENVLSIIKKVPLPERTARFLCYMAACTPAGEHRVAEGAWDGLLAFEPAGHNGFGYDPVFFDPEKQCTAAQMDAREKNSRSHRAKAVAALLKEWPAFWQKWILKGF